MLPQIKVLAGWGSLHRSYSVICASALSLRSWPGHPAGSYEWAHDRLRSLDTWLTGDLAQ